MSANTESLYQDHVLGNYGMPPLTFVRGEGTRLWDDGGRSYLDFCAGIAVVTMGHSHPKVVSAIQAQAAELTHVSNLFRNEQQAALAAKLNGLAGGGGKVFFCNSGAEANETLIKLSRLFGRAKAGEEGRCYQVIVAAQAFHGRTFGGMSATPQEKIQGGFRPLVPGFVTAAFNDLDSFRTAITDDTAAILVETIQGEGGIRPADADFLRGLRALCDEKGILLLVDEVQCGVGRTGTFFAYEQAGIRPDAIGMAKGLGNGSPIGAVWIDDRHAGLFTPGSHGTTFGGTPLVCAAALATLEAMEEEAVLDNVATNGAYVMEQLQALKAKFPDYIVQVRGRGFMIGIQVAEPPGDLVALLREKGLIVPSAGGNVVRFLPPLVATRDDFDEALAILAEGVRERAAAAEK
ncbi:aspartate aminotransferase family protein [Marinihelvus fidelis]|uniref:Acetylornithine aminotransferase n=1 Tax=Marinihelvus fidelis TaxID=2613842 RepID=A0A5N0TGD2_9GAMM|nr:aspartate aminotransferase family protein [Marinihelvus fidelis]KAA9134112.1 aspartate aminotransferase family protein [Marinihelvus fidelis]